MLISYYPTTTYPCFEHYMAESVSVLFACMRIFFTSGNRVVGYIVMALISLNVLSYYLSYYPTTTTAEPPQPLLPPRCKRRCFRGGRRCKRWGYVEGLNIDKFRCETFGNYSITQMFLTCSKTLWSA
jgi:hypothetical protein